MNPRPRPVQIRTYEPDKRDVKKWVEKLVEQFDFDWTRKQANGEAHSMAANLSEERATLLYIIDTFNKHLMEVEGHPIRKTREQLDEFAKDLLTHQGPDIEKSLFRFRQFLAGYRLDEVAFVQKNFEDFRSIIWDLVDQLAEDLGQEQQEDEEIKASLEELKDAVESNSIVILKNQSRKFIDRYMEKQFKREARQTSRMKSIRKNLNTVKKQLVEANDKARTDHLTGAFNRKSFDEYSDQFHKLWKASSQPVSLLIFDIDHFKKINDTFGHDVGDFVLKELVQTLKGIFTRESDVLARIGGEEFAALLPNYSLEAALKKAEEVLSKVRSEVFIHQDKEIRFTVSIGVAQLGPNETISMWMKRADQALYNSKNSGRNRLTIAQTPLKSVA